MAESPVYYEHGDLQQQIHIKAVMGSKREGGSSPLPSWKLYKNPFYDGLAAAVVAAASAAAAVAMAAEHRDDEETEDDEGNKYEQKQGFQAESNAKMARESMPVSSSSPIHRVSSAYIATKGGYKAHPAMATSARPRATSLRRGSLAMAGGNSGDLDKSATQRSRGMHGGSEKELIGRGRAAKNPMGMAHRSLVNMKEVLCEETAMAKPYTVFLPVPGENAPGSPCSHLQPRPPSSTSDSPCSSKPTKASKVSTRSPQLNKSPQRTSLIGRPLKTISLMQPKTGGEVARLRGSASKSASSNQCSPLRRDSAEQLVALTDGEIITSPRDYLKSINRTRGFEEKPMDRSPVIPVLSKELKRALNRVQELELSQISARKEVDGLLKRFADERTLLKSREQEKIQAAVLSIEDELNMERKLRRKLEMENRKLSRNLAEASRAVVKAEKDLDKERKARQLMEEVCDELAKEIGEDKAEFEELKREHEKAREEMEEERSTLQMTEAWREERVQMKLSDAKFELEERCLVLDKLKMELEMYLDSCRGQGIEPLFESQGENLREAVEKMKTETSLSVLLLENGSSHHPPHSQDDAVYSDDVLSSRLSRDNIRSHSEWGANSDEHVKERAKWVIDPSARAHAREDLDRIIASDDSARDEPTLKITSYPEVHKDSWIRNQPVSRWRRKVESKTGAIRAMGCMDFDGSDAGEENDAESNGADSTRGEDGEGGYGNTEEGRWREDGEDDGRALRHHMSAPGSVSEVEKESSGSFSPEPSRRAYKKGKNGFNAAGLDESRRNHRTRRHNRDAGSALMPVAREHAIFSDSRHDGEGDRELSSAAGSSPGYGHSPDVMAEKGNWRGLPVYRSVSQGRRVPVESSALRGRKAIAEWAKHHRSHDLQTELLLDGMSGLHLQSSHSKGARSRR